MGQLKLWVGDLAGAERAWLHISDLQPKNELSFGNLGYLYAYELKDYAKGEQYYLIAKTNNPTNLQYYRDLHTIYKVTQQPDKAEAVLLEAKDRMSKEIDVYTMLGEYYKERGDTAKALTAYQQALRLAPTDEALKQEVANLKAAL